MRLLAPIFVLAALIAPVVANAATSIPQRQFNVSTFVPVTISLDGLGGTALRTTTLSGSIIADTELDINMATLEAKAQSFAPFLEENGLSTSVSPLNLTLSGARGDLEFSLADLEFVFEAVGGSAEVVDGAIPANSLRIRLTGGTGTLMGTLDGSAVDETFAMADVAPKAVSGDGGFSIGVGSDNGETVTFPFSLALPLTFSASLDVNGSPLIFALTGTTIYSGTFAFDSFVPPSIELFTPLEPQHYLGLPAKIAYSVSGSNITVRMNQNVGELAGTEGVVTVAPTTLEEILPRGSAWKFLDDGSNQRQAGGTAFYEEAFDDGAWREGQAPLGYGGGHRTFLRPGANAQTPHPVFYFRKTFDVDEDDLASYAGVLLEYRRDDALIIYLNGQEIGRDNLPAGEVDAQAFSPVEGVDADGAAQYHRMAVDKSLLRAGENTIAVELHQSATDVANTLFDLGLHGQLFANVDTLVKEGDTWRFLDTGVKPVPQWRLIEFNDTSWREGPAPLGYNDELLGTTVEPNREGGGRVVTYYFRNGFSIDDPSQIETLMLRVRRDDGAAVFINGTEVLRSNLPPAPAPLTFDTFALSEISGADEEAYLEVDLTERLDLLRAGDNVVAVEVHQDRVQSRDLFFGLQLEGTDVLGQPVHLARAADFWRYADDGLDYGTEWRALEYDDLEWKNARGPLGFDLDTAAPGEVFQPATPTSNGVPGARGAVTYFRKAFNIDAATLTEATEAQLRLLLDDAAVIHLNDKEFYRTPGLPVDDPETNDPDEGDLDPNEYFDLHGDADGFVEFPIDLEDLQAGKNVIAIELRQRAPDNPDFALDMELKLRDVGASVLYTLSVSSDFGTEVAQVPISPQAAPGEPVLWAGGTNGWNNPQWIDGLRPSPGKDFLVDGQYHGSVATSDFAEGVIDAFGGRSLKLDGENARLFLRGKGNTALIGNLTLQNAALVHDEAAATVGIGGAGAVFTLSESPKFVVPDAESTMVIEAQLRGDGYILVSSDAADLSGQSTGGVVVLNQPSPLLNSRWEISGATLRASAEDALGGGRLTLRHGGLEIGYNLNAGSRLVIEEADVAPFSKVTLSRNIVLEDVVFEKADGEIVSALDDLGFGTFNAARLNTLAGAPLFVDEGGTVSFGAAADADGDQLLDSWEQEHFPDLSVESVLATADPDSDGRSNLQEQTEGTDPNDGASYFYFRKLSDRLTDSFSLEFPVVSGRIYLVQYTEDIDVGWQNAGGAIFGSEVVGSGNATGMFTFVDDGSNTGSPPGEVRRRYYRVIVVGAEDL